MLYTNDRVTVRFDGGTEISRPWLKADQDRAQRVLGNHADERAVCLCRPGGVPMHVVCRGGTYHLATMPGRAHHHALSCPSYRADDDTSGLRHYQPAALSGSAKGRKVKLSTRSPGRPPFPHFSPSAVLELLWESAGLHVCTPKTVEKRNYFMVVKSIDEIVHHFQINAAPFKPYLPLVRSDPGYCSHVIGQVSRVSHGSYSNAIRLSGDRDNTFWVDQKVWDASPLVQTFGPFESPDYAPRIFLMARLFVTDHGNFRLYDIGLLPVSEQYLPIRHVDPGTLTSLIDAGRRFFVCQRYDAVGDDTIPSLVIVDRDKPQPVFALPRH